MSGHCYKNWLWLANCSLRIVSRRRAAYSRSRSCCHRWKRWRMRSRCYYRSHLRRTRCTRQRIPCASHPCTKCTRAPTRRHSSSSNQTAIIPSRHIADGTTLAHCVRIRWWWVPASHEMKGSFHFRATLTHSFSTCRATTIDAAMAFRPRAASRRLVPHFVVPVVSVWLRFIYLYIFWFDFDFHCILISNISNRIHWALFDVVDILTFSIYT